VPSRRTLTVLGCDGSWTGPGGNGSGYLIRAGATSILVDAGPGTFAQLQESVDPGRVTAVIVTHAHPDHWTDLESFASWTGFGPGRARSTEDGSVLRVYAPPGVQERSSFSSAEWVHWHELAPSLVLSFGSVQARFIATHHGPPTVAVWLRHQAATLAYSADSGPDWSVREFGDGIGTFLCEATYTTESEGTALHLSGRQAGEMARAAGVGRLIITHRWPTVAADDVRREAEAAFGQPVGQAETAAVFDW
jgi:ribonuclease BN (tRNA processing enzyme)